MHSINNLRLAKNNAGVFGGNNLRAGPMGEPGIRDAFTGKPLGIGSEFPASSYLIWTHWAVLMVAAVVDQDTVVSTAFTLWSTGPGLELSPDKAPFGDLVRRSTLDPELPGYKEAVSQEDIVAIYTDTFKTHKAPWVGRDYMSQRRHLPLNIEITDRSYAWSYGYAEDFVLFDLSIENIGTETLKETFVGICVWPLVKHDKKEAPGGDDVCGFLKRAPSPVGCGHYDTVNIAWHADGDGDPVGGRFQDEFRPYRSVPHVAGIRFFEARSVRSRDEPTISFNWYIHSIVPELNWGPRRKEDFRDFGTGGLGWPLGDRNLYHVMSGGEIDYDVTYTASIKPYDGTWRYPPPGLAEDVANGHLCDYILSTGPFEVPPGADLPIAFAYVCGEDLHTDPANARRNLPHDPWAYNQNLDFSDLVKNAMWAEWIYDNPGVDTDGDGYAGEFEICVHDSVLQGGHSVPTAADTFWVEGDGIPDWRAAGPPPAPEFWVTPIENGIHVRFNGYRSETDVDIFSRIVDFEGYRIYLGRDDRWDNMSLLASYDRQDYDKWVWRSDLDTAGMWQVEGVPYSLDSLRCFYGRPPDPCGDMDFDPLSTSPQNPYRHPEYPDSTFYFVKHDYNASEFGFSTPITKIYPEAEDPSQWHPDSIPDYAYTDDGYLKYYEYEYTIENLLPTVPYWVNVTAFDFGSPAVRLQSLETSRTLGSKKIYPLAPGHTDPSKELNVYIYPNPYRIDANYRDRGYEGRMRQDRPDNRVRAVHFENLPPKCTISIYSLDGDLVRRIPHDMPPGDPNSHHDFWDLITRNTQEPVSGLYYWVVEAPDGRTQIGKLVLIM